MAAATMTDRMRTTGLVAAHVGRALLSGLAGIATVGATPRIERILIAPQDLRTVDPTVASDIYAGTFVFSGQIAECGGRTPFDIAPPSTDWARALHGFGWLRHLRAAATATAHANARALVDDWIRLARVPDVAWEPEVAARRLTSWLSQSPMLLDGADDGFYRRFVRQIARHMSKLRRMEATTPDGLPRLRVAAAQLSAAIAAAPKVSDVRAALKRLDRELKRQILADGGHVGRNPLAILEALVEILPLRQALPARNVAPSPTLTGAIDRMMPMLRFFRHPDGTVAHFHGAGATPTDLVATVLAYDDTRGQPLGHAPFSGYQRLEAKKSVVLFDVGPPPATDLSGEAHAGALAFEFSGAGQRIVVNCGVPLRATADWKRLARATAAHSTAVLGDTSSARFAKGRLAERTVGPVIVRGPREVPSGRDQVDGGERVYARHDGYLESFGVVHERQLILSADGDRLDGADRFIVTGKGERATGPIAVRFHLHPAVRVSLLRNGQAVLLATADGQSWEFVVEGADLALEESVYLADRHGIRRSQQIVLSADLAGRPDVRWAFLRQARERSTTRRPEAGTLSLEGGLPL